MYYLFIDFLVCLHCESVCLHWKIRRFTAFLDSKIHTRLAIVNANELALALPPKNLPKKFRPDPYTFYLVIVVTDKQPDRQTYAGDYIIPAKRSFRGDNNTLTTGLTAFVLKNMLAAWSLDSEMSGSPHTFPVTN